MDSDKVAAVLKFSSRKSDDELKWGNEVKGLSVAIAPDVEKDQFLIRWKNIGKDTFVLPCVRMNRGVLWTRIAMIYGIAFS